MGHRAHYVIKSGGFWERYYSQCGGYTLELDLLTGPTAATRFARGQRPFGTWMYNTECDGAALIDHDERRLLWFSRFLGAVAYRQAVLDVIERMWAGWRIDWAYGGLPEIRRALGDDDGMRPWAFRDLTPASEDRPPCLLTVEKDATVRAYMVAEGAHAVLGHDLDSLMRYCERWRPVRVWPCLPSSGVHLDVDHRAGGAWTLGLVDARGPGWPGWSWEHWGDRHSEHLSRAKGAIDLPAVDLSAGLRMLAEEFDRHRGLDAGTPVTAQLLEFAGALRGAAESVGMSVAAAGDAPGHGPLDPTEEERGRVRAVLAALRH